MPVLQDKQNSNRGPGCANSDSGASFTYHDNNQMKKTAIILGGGEGHRAGGELPKQFRLLHGMPVLWWSMRAFRLAYPDVRLIVIIHPEYLRDWEEIVSSWPENLRIDHEYYCGGRSRHHSVVNALMAVDATDGLIAVHDGARPCVTPAMIVRGFEAAANDKATVPAVPLTDSIRRIEGKGSVAVPRADYRAVQTPQVFDSALLKHAYALPEKDFFTDDASVVESYGEKVGLYEGEPDNIKITYPRDFITAEAILDSRER